MREGKKRDVTLLNKHDVPQTIADAESMLQSQPGIEEGFNA